MESVRSAQVLADYWIKCADVYTDQPFWKHKLTGEVVVDRPSIQNYLPPNFTVPVLTHLTTYSLTHLTTYSLTHLTTYSLTHLTIYSLN